MNREDAGGDSGGPENPDIEDLLDELDALEDAVDAAGERQRVRRTIALVERMPGSRAFTTRVKKYTTRDVAESFVGSVIFALPLLVEDGVFAIAEWFAAAPVFLVSNVVFVMGMTAGLLYYAEFRDVKITDPLFGFLPRRYVGTLLVSLVTAVVTLLLWGRLVEEDPTAMEQVGRVAVIWSAGAFGAALGDILPGESTGRDVGELLD